MIPIKLFLKITFLLISMVATSLTAKEIQWKQLPSIPDEEGFAGMYSGVSNGVLVVAGGANFPDK